MSRGDADRAVSRYLIPLLVSPGRRFNRRGRRDRPGAAIDDDGHTTGVRDGGFHSAEPGETGQGCPSLLEEETSLTQTVCYSTPPATAAPRVDAGSVRRDPVTRRRYSSSPRGHHAERSR